MELELGLALPCSDLKNASLCCRKRGFDEMKTTLPLFMQEEDGGDGGGSDGDHREAENLQGIILGARVVVGWPPVKLQRRNSGEDCCDSRKRTNCVKVYMEGMAIGRKVDLSLHHSYHALFHTLNLMFPKMRHDGEEDEGYYKVTYEDEDGDWMLIGDVPWEAFIQSVNRLKILN